MFFTSLFGSAAQQTDGLSILSASEYKEAIATGKVQLVDVRTSQEYRAGHIKNAKNIDFFQHAQFEKEFEKLDKTKPVYIYCRSGSRSKNAARKLLAMGFVQIYDLQGGFMGWR